MNSKVCRACGEEKPLEAFAQDGKGRLGRVAQCKACINARQRAHYAQHRTELREAKNANNNKHRYPVSVLSKVCRDCGLEKPAGDFPRMSRNRDGLYIYCRECVAIRYKRYTANGAQKRQAFAEKLKKWAGHDKTLYLLP